MRWCFLRNATNDQHDTVILNAIKRLAGYKKDYDLLLASNKTEAEYSGTQLKMVIRLKKRKADPAMPSKAPGVKNMYHELKCRAMPSLDEYLMDLQYKHAVFEPLVAQLDALLVVQNHTPLFPSANPNFNAEVPVPSHV